MLVRFQFIQNVCPFLVAVLLAVPNALATDFTWTGFADEQYFNYLNWLPFDPGVITGPPTTNDTATIANGDSVFVNQDFSSEWSINGLTLSGGSKLYNVPTLNFFPPPGHEIHVDNGGGSPALTQLSGSGTELVVWKNVLGTSADGFDSDLMAVNNGATVSLSNGRLEVDRFQSGVNSSVSLDINSGATLRGYGWVDLDGFSASPFIVLQNDGLIHVYPYGVAGTPNVTLAITASQSNGRIDLDGTTGNGAVLIANNGTLILNRPLNDAFDGQITMQRNTAFELAADWTNNTGGVIDINAGTGTATIRGGATPNTFTNNGTINVNSGTLVMASNYIDNGTTIHVGGQGSDATLRLEADAVIANPDFNGAGAGTTHLVVTNGSHTTINATSLDWDSDGAGTTTVDVGSVLNLNVAHVDIGNEIFDGTITDKGALYVNGPAWTMAGTLNVIATAPVIFDAGTGTWQMTGVTNISGPDVTMLKGDVEQFHGTLNFNSGIGRIMSRVRAEFYGPIHVATGATAQFEGVNIFAASSELIRQPNSTAIFNGNTSFLGDTDLDGPNDDLTTVVGDGQTLTLFGAINGDPLKPDVFGGELRLGVGATFDVQPTGIVPLMLDCDPGNPFCGSVLKQNSTFKAIELLVKNATIRVEGTGPARLDTKVTSKPDSVFDAGLGELIVEKQLTTDGGQFTGKRLTLEGGLHAIGDTQVMVELLDTLSIDVEDLVTLSLSSTKLNSDPLKPDVFGGELRLGVGATFDVQPTGIDPLMLGCDPDNPFCGSVLKQDSTFKATELLVKNATIRVEGTGPARLDTKVTSTPDSIIDAGLGELIVEKQLTTNGGQFTGKRLTPKGGLRVIGDTQVMVELLDVTGRTIDVDDQITLSVHSTKFNSDPLKPREIDGAQISIAGHLEFADASGPISFDAGASGTPARVVFDQVSDQMPSMNGNVEFHAWRANFGTTNGTGKIETPRFWLSYYGECSGNLFFQADVSTIEGRISPGNSPGTMQFAGDLELAATTQLLMELAGTTPGIGHDQLIIGGQATLGGTLEVASINGFTPSAGDVFDLFDWGSAVGTFDTVSLPALGVNLRWDTTSLYTLGELQVVAFVPGDYNDDGIVNAADYALFRKYEGTPHVLANDPLGGTIGQAQYDQWRTHFGQSAGSGSFTDIQVPEPATCLLAMIGFGVLCWQSTRTARCRSKS